MVEKINTYISLFSGAGVGCYGLKKNNFQCIATNELIKRRLEVQKLNNVCKYKSGYILGSLKDEETVTSIKKEILFWKDKLSINSVDLVIATPPCQGMSLANHKKSTNEIKRNSLVVEAIKQIDYINSKFFIFENVSMFLKSVCTDIDTKEKSIESAINYNLSKKYKIHSKVLNLKNHGNNSSRTRTIVIGVRDDIKYTDIETLFPEFRESKLLKDTIGSLPRLNNMCDFDEKDFWHYFRPYNNNMLPWVANTKYGDTAFNNEKDIHKPHKVINNEIIIHKNKNADKYKRQSWEKVAPCIHTRNDTLASQNTIHPIDNRVFSVRELMLMMTIPNDFKWIDLTNKELNLLSRQEKIKLYKLHEINIRQCIGESVPTNVVYEITKKMKKILND